MVGSGWCAGDHPPSTTHCPPSTVQSKTFAGKVTVDKWLPGSVELFTEDFFKGAWDLPNGEVASASDTLLLPADMPGGEYSLSVAVVAADSLQPVIRLGIKGRGEDGWYALSKVRLSR